MFPTRFFADVYFAPRYWPKVGSGTGAPAALPDVVVRVPAYVSTVIA